MSESDFPASPGLPDQDPKPAKLMNEMLRFNKLRRARIKKQEEQSEPEQISQTEFDKMKRADELYAKKMTAEQKEIERKLQAGEPLGVASGLLESEDSRETETGE